jgi:hypothetical protein
MYRHRIFDLAVAAEFEIPELPVLRHGWVGARELRVSLATELKRPQRWFLEWPVESASPEFRVGHVPGGYLLEYPEAAACCFIAEDAGYIKCEYQGQADLTELRRVLIDQAIPRARALQGELVLHAAGIGLGGRAVALMGPSGFGKSTLSGAFAARGYSVLCDDALSLGVDAANVDCVGAYRGLRLWPDSAANAGIAGFRRGAVSARTTKLRLLPTDPMDDVLRLPLQAILLLDRLAPGMPEGIEVALEPVSESMAYLTSQCFKLDTSDSRHWSLLLAGIARVVETVPVIRVFYPRRYDLLPLVVKRIMAHVDSAGGRRRSGTGA